jgi:two-component system, NarL family, invasion response regulator UvrY
MTTKTTTVKLAVVDDHNLFRKGLIKLINMGDTDNRYQILFEADNGIDFKAKLDPKNVPDIILMDIGMPNMDGFETVDWIRRSFPKVNILVVSMLESKKDVIRMIKLRVKGYLTKDIEVDDVHNALEAIAEGGTYYTERVSAIMADIITGDNGGDDPKSPEEEEVVARLTENEREFVKLSCTELTYHQIAEKMQLSTKTIEGYRESLFIRFKVKNRVSLAMYAVRNGLVKP